MCLSVRLWWGAARAAPGERAWDRPPAAVTVRAERREVVVAVRVERREMSAAVGVAPPAEVAPRAGRGPAVPGQRAAQAGEAVVLSERAARRPAPAEPVVA